MREQILRLLEMLPPTRGLQYRGKTAWIRCPVHAGGNEDTPSFRIQLEGPWVGHHYCFACTAHGDWKDTVNVLGFPSSARFLASDVVSDTFSDEEAEAMLRGGKVKRDDATREPWPRDYPWRGVPGTLVSDVGGTFVMQGLHDPVLRLPVNIRGREAGWIDCVIDPEPGEKLKYINSADASGWSKSALFPYDYVRSLPLSRRILAIVEGPRDALITINNGLPALATLGASSWNNACKRLVLSVNPATVLLMLDPDDAGEKLRRQAYADLVEHVDILSVRLPSKLITDPETRQTKRKKLLDPGDLDSPKLRRVLKTIGVRLPEYAGVQT